MIEFRIPWLTLALLIPLAGAWLVRAQRDRQQAAWWGAATSLLTLLATLGAWGEYIAMGASVAHDPLAHASGWEGLVFDALNAPLIPLAALLYLLVAIATLRAKPRRFSFSGALASEAILLATLMVRTPWPLILLLILGILPPLFELRLSKAPTRIYRLHMGLFAGLLLTGGMLLSAPAALRPWAAAPLVLAILIRCGVAPFHCWLTDLFEHATFGAALLQTLPFVGAYAAARLLIPLAPASALQITAKLALVMAIYAAGMALVQTEARRLFCYLYLSQSALVLVGLMSLSPIGVTGALCLWLAVALALAGFGLTLRALEARHGRLSLVRYHGMYEHTPALAVCFLLSGVASVGFPGTFGFLGSELLIDGAVQAFPFAGLAVILAAALNGIAVMQAYFKIFTGVRFQSPVPLGVGPREWIVVITLAILIFAGGILPQSGATSRYRAATELLEQRAALLQEKAESVHPETESLPGE
jgi:NADH-quinone oxidoreductase subunit M